MNSIFHKLLLFFLFIFIITTSPPSSARKMASQKDDQINYTNGNESGVKIASVDSFDKLMGVEECGNEDEECFKRRAVLEAHLDYIYTQSRIP